MRMSLEKSIADVDRAFARGDLLLAFDQACAHQQRFPESEVLKHKGLLALANAGATERAARLFREWGLDRSSNADVLALEGRLAKDRALGLSGDAQRAALRDAAAVYKRIFERKPSYYTAINWASLAFLAGDDEAESVARRVLADPAVASAADYWGLATRAEARLVLGDAAAARGDLAAAAACPEAGAVHKARTARQLRLLLRKHNLDDAAIDGLLKPLAPPVTLNVVSTAATGEGWEDYSRRGVAAQARQRIACLVAELKPGAVFTSLASGGEVILAEQALAAGVELNVVLPLPQPAFVEHFLGGAGPKWVKRFQTCCRKARRVVFVSDDPYAEDPSLADYGARVAMGLALLRAQHLDGEAAQVLLLEGGRGIGEATNSAVRVWTERRRRQVPLQTYDGQQQPVARKPSEARQSRAVVFGDLPGFSALPEKALPIFWNTVMKAIGDVVQSGGEAVALKNTWGDAIHLVVSDVQKAAEICLAVQRRLSGLDGSVLGRDEPPTMRIGAHYGPVFQGWDHVAAQNTYYGRALSRAARIEPITPPGTVYVTEAFAAVLLLESEGEFTCTYVGQVPLAKGFGTFRMYDLVARSPDPALGAS